MTNINFMKPVVDIEATGNNIKSLRIKNGFSVHEIQNIFGFEYPQAVYSWEQGRNIPSIDNLMVLSRLFDVSVENIIVCNMVEVEVSCTLNKAEKLCSRDCDGCKKKLIA